MHNLARQIVLVLAIVSFLAMVTGLISVLHISSQKCPEEHDSAHCPICQQLLTMQGGFVSNPEQKIDDIDQFEYCILPCNAIFIERRHIQPFGPRPPPEAS
jgi:hypothetical protein